MCFAGIFVQVVNHTRNRTKPVKGQFVAGNYMCSFAGEKLVLPVNDPSKRFILYVAAVTITKGENEQGKIYKDISLMGIGFSQPFEVNACKVSKGLRAFCIQDASCEAGRVPSLIRCVTALCHAFLCCHTLQYAAPSVKHHRNTNT